MCGISGLVQLDDRPVDGRLLEAMTSSLAHRGPDGEGYVLLAPGGEDKPIAITGRLSRSLRSLSHAYSLGLGHRRLAVLDPSPLGHQPMSNENETIWLTYNGEIYNYLELRQELKALGWQFRSGTDTEVILNAYQQWGAACLERLNGMFAFAIWDESRNELFCARDRLGMKPFYYRLAQQRFAFASEIKALLKDPDLARSPNPRMAHDYLLFGLQDHSGETFFEGIRQLQPGHYLIVRDGHSWSKKWWDLPAQQLSLETEDEVVIRSFRDLFEDVIRIHLRSDVSLGSCLSGGLDSSSIVCTVHRLLASNTHRELPGTGKHRLNTFSSCFEDPACDERRYHRAVVNQTGAESVEVFPDGRSLFEDLPRVLWFQDEPFGGSSFLAQWAVMRAASQHGVKVLLDGQGGDELLCGYPGYWGSYLGDLFRIGAVGTFLREAWSFREQQARIHPTVFANFARALLPVSLLARTRSTLKGDSLWVNPEFAAYYTDRRSLLAYECNRPTTLANHTAAYLQTHSLPALLHHEDRNSMAFSIEARLPFLDARLLEFVVALPARFKLRNGQSKFLLRRAMQGVLPEEVRLRSDKMGFVTPQDRWLRETWRSDLQEVFCTRSFEHRGYWDAASLRKSYRDYCEGRNSIGQSVWRCLTLELWHQQFFT